MNTSTNNTQITPAMLAELEDKAKAATPGPWYAHNTPSGNMIEGTNCEWVMGSNSPCNNCKLTQGFSPKDFDILGEIDAVSIPEEDLHYIAAASPDVVQELIKAVRDLLDTVEDRCLTCGMPNEKRMACVSECYVGQTLKKYGVDVPENQELR